MNEGGTPGGGGGGGGGDGDGLVEGERAGSRPILHNPAFVRLWVGATASGLATWALPFVLGLAVIRGELSAAGLGMMLAARTLGFIAAVPAGGLLADRLSTVAVMRVAGLSVAAASPVLALTAGRLDWVAALACLVMGAGQGACRPAFQAHVPRVVDAARRREANAAITLAVRVSVLLGPAGTAMLARTMSARSLVFGIGVLWLVAAVVPSKGSRATDDRGPAAQPTRPLQDLVDGFTEARRHRWFVAGLAALAPIIAFGYSATSIVLPVVSQDHYGSDAVFAAATTAYTVGALLGALVMGRWHPRDEGWIAFLGLGLYSLAPLVLLLAPPAGVVIGAYALIGIGMEMFNVPWFTATQREVAPDTLARVSSVDFVVSYGLAPLGLAIYPAAIATFGRTPVLAVTAVLCIVAPVLAALAPGARRFVAPVSAAR